MDDRELLEMAAKAAGMFEKNDIDWRKNDDGTWTHILDCEGRQWEIWNPLEDDGDALRLAFHLGMSVDLGSCIIEFDEDNGLEWDGSDGDICHARRAIVRTAAEIGRSMP